MRASKFKYLFLTFLVLVNQSFTFEQKNRKIYAVVLLSGTLVVGLKNPVSGLFISDDDGKTWFHKGWENIKAFSIAIEPDSDGETIYLAAGNGILKSTDGGITWRIMTDWRITEVLGVVVHPYDKNTVFIATPYGVFKSTDAGWTWIEVKNGIKPEETGTTSSTFVSSILIDSGSKNRILIGTEDGIYESLDGGNTWRLLALKGISVRTIVQSPHDSKFLMAGTEDKGIFKSTDGGKTWKRVGKNLENSTIYTICFDPKNKNVIYAGGFKTGVCRSNDAGNTWAYSKGSFESVHSIAVHPDDSNFIVIGTLDGGVYLSKDSGESWVFSGLDKAIVYTVVIE